MFVMGERFGSERQQRSGGAEERRSGGEGEWKSWGGSKNATCQVRFLVMTQGHGLVIMKTSFPMI